MSTKNKKIAELSVDYKDKLLLPDEPPAVTVERPQGHSPYFITCDHAGNKIPRRLAMLGLEKAHLERHIAYDIGALAVAQMLSAQLDAALVSQTYSRLVIDCNRQPEYDTSIPLASEDTPIPGNFDLDATQIAARQYEIFDPYHRAIADLLISKKKTRPTVFIALHSFTPKYQGVSRPWHIGLLYHRDDRLSQMLKHMLSEDTTLCIGENEPYALGGVGDYSIAIHAEQHGLPYLAIELRQDLISTSAQQNAWARRLGALLQRMLPTLDNLFD